MTNILQRILNTDVSLKVSRETINRTSVSFDLLPAGEENKVIKIHFSGNNERMDAMEAWCTLLPH